jgi:hypothetical protein
MMVKIQNNLDNNYGKTQELARSITQAPFEEKSKITETKII